MEIFDLIFVLGMDQATDSFYLVWLFILLFTGFRYHDFLVTQPRKFIARIIFGGLDGKEESGVVRWIVAAFTASWVGFVGWMITNAIFVFFEGTGIALGLNGSLMGLTVSHEIIIFYYLLGLTIIGKMGFDMMTLVDEFMVRMDVATEGEEE